MRARLAVLLTVVLAVVALPVSAGAQSSVEQAEARQAAAQAAATEAVADYEDALARYYELDGEIARLRADIERVESDSAELREAASLRAVEAYMGVRNDFSTVIADENALEAVRRNEFLERVNAEGVDAIDRLGAINDDLAARESDLESAISTQEAVVADLDALNEQMQQRLAEANDALVEAQQEEARRQAAAAAAAEAARRAAASSGGSSGGTSSGGSSSGGSSSGGSSSGGSTGGSSSGGTVSAAPAATFSGGGLTCPVAGAHSFVDTWGAPRSGGRSHQGVDIMASYGTPLVAAVGGTVRQSTSSLGGNQVWLYGNDGNTYFYAHLQSYTGGGGAVSAGQQVGTVGDTGNARGTPHLHFEVHPGGGGAVNPFPYASAACPGG